MKDENNLPRTKNKTFVRHLLDKGLRQNTINLYVSCLTALPPQCLKNVNEANDKIRDFLSRQIGSTRVYYYSLLAWFDYFDKKQKRRLTKPSINFKKLKPIYKNFSEILKGIESIPEEHYKIGAIIQLYGGLRVSEMLSIKLEDIMIKDEEMVIVITKAKKDPYVVFFQDDSYPYHKLKDYLGKHNFSPLDWIFCDNSRLEKANDYYFLRNFIETNRKKYGRILKEHTGLKTHDLKRNLAHHLIEKNIPLVKVKELLHHRNIQTTMIYVGQLDQRKISNILSEI